MSLDLVGIGKVADAAQKPLTEAIKSTNRTVQTGITEISQVLNELDRPALHITNKKGNIRADISILDAYALLALIDRLLISMKSWERGQPTSAGFLGVGQDSNEQAFFKIMQQSRAANNVINQVQGAAGSAASGLGINSVKDAATYGIPYYGTYKLLKDLGVF